MLLGMSAMGGRTYFQNVKRRRYTDVVLTRLLAKTSIRVS